MKISAFFGTRPETIKLASFIKTGIQLGHEVDVIFTGQHREMALPLLDFFQIKPTVDLNIMRPNQDLISMSSLILNELNTLKDLENTDALIVQGDTTSAFIGAYWAFLKKIPVIHLEAGLRTHDIMTPFPEEANRQLISRIARVHLAPSDKAMLALRNEGIEHNAFMIGNTGLDTLRMVNEKVSDEILPLSISEFIDHSPYVLITTHRRENFGSGMQNIAEATLALAQKYPHVKFVFPVHFNPNVRCVMEERLKGVSNILLTQPLLYLPFVALMKGAKAILTDSGGIQEEAPTLRVPVVVMRESTERPESVEQGFSTLVGTNINKIIEAIAQALEHGCQGRGDNPYGDGHSSQKAWEIITRPGVVL